jgi:serine/threonine protein kinase
MVINFTIPINTAIRLQTYDALLLTCSQTTTAQFESDIWEEKEMASWKGGKTWEEVGPLGKGGQSQVFLVRNEERQAQMRQAVIDLDRYSNQNLNQERATKFVDAIFEFGRDEVPSELGALKKYNPRAAGQAGEQQALARLQIEIAVLKEGRAGLPKLLDSNETEQWIVTEYFPLSSLDRHMNLFSGKAKAALTAFRSLVKTVANLHDSNIVHRDIKPHNVFLSANPETELILGDFGIAFLPNEGERPTFTNESVGPHDYMPPWVYGDARAENIDATFDIYELGKLLWCMVAGRMKLNREWFTRTTYDLTVQFPGDPDMYAINEILKRCINESREKCLPNAGKLLSLVDEVLSIMRRGGQILSPGTPRPCHVCGIGFYQHAPSQINRFAAVPVGTSASGMPEPGSWRHEGALYAEAYACDICGHVQFFKPVPKRPGIGGC